MHSDVSFLISLNSQPYPVRFDSEVLDEFQRDHIDDMEWELKKLSDEHFGPEFFLNTDNQLGLVAPLIRNAIMENDGVTVAKYVLWLAARHPEISGIRIDEDTYEYVAEAFDDFSFEGQTIH